MITSFNIFESNDIFPFNIGDIVVCVYADYENRLIVGNKYKVTDVFEYGDNFFCNINGVRSFFSCNRFAKELDYYANKYNL